MSTVLVIDDDRTIRHQLQHRLAHGGHDVIEAASAEDGLSMFASRSPDVVILDIMLPNMSGLDLFRRFRQNDRKTPVIFVTSATDSATAIEAMQLGAFDYVTKPLDLQQLETLVGKAIDAKRLMDVPVAIGATRNKLGQGELFVGSSPIMLEVFKQIGRVASQKVPVLIRGESGTGKELVARALYQHGDRIDEPFIAVNCAAIPDQLLESELFGHEKGAFTGAEKRRIGKFEQCNGGTIFLDEVGEMTPLVQGKVLRLLQDQQFERVGGNETISTDVRIVTATNRDLERMVEQGQYRADLFYRLNGMTIALPPLRERGDDLDALLEYFLSRLRTELKKPEVEGFAEEAVVKLREYRWPGNVRELQSVVRQALINTTGTVITADNLPSDIVQIPINTNPTTTTNSSESKHDEDAVDLAEFIQSRLNEDTSDLYAETLEVMERILISETLRHTGGNQSKASQILGITRGKIRDRIATFGIRVDKSVTIDDE